MTYYYGIGDVSLFLEEYEREIPKE